MSDSPAAERPRQVTVAAWVGGGAGVGLVLTAGELIAQLRTVDGRDGVSQAVRDLGLGVSVDQALSVARAGLLICGAFAAATVVLAFFVARRDKSARIGMTVAAVPILVCGLFFSQFLAAAAVVAAALLWTAPARDWYAGRAPRPVVRPTAPEPVAPPPPAVSTPSQPGWPAPQAYAAYGVSRPAAAAPAGQARRPAQVVAACVLTWIGSLVVLAGIALAASTLGDASFRDEVRRVLEDNQALREAGYTVDTMVVLVSVMLGVIAVWALVAIGLAGFAFARQGWARVTLLVSAGVAGVGSLALAIANPGFLLVTLMCAVTFRLLLQRQSADWYASRPRRAVVPPAPRVRPPDQPW